MKCPECGYENREEARFCLECGAKLENVCPQCGARLPPGAKFCDDCGARLPEARSTTPPRLEDMQKQLQDRIPQSLADKLFAGAKQMQGEYRLVTALFADVSGSSGMARELPLEQYVETMNDCFKMMVDTISIKYEGSINRFIGDCVLAFFGAPITHENDAERAILAALDIREAVKALDLDVSTGINTGMTYVGEMGSDLTYSERSAWGPDVDFARRLQEAAGPGQIWVGASTYRLTRRALDFGKTVEIEAKGTTGTAYPVLHVKEHPEKLRGIEGLRARMIGREREFSDLKEAADGLISGRGSIVTIIGEAGLGKSRLAWELKEYLDKRLETSDMRQEDDDTTSLKSDVSGLKSHVSGLVSILEGRSISIGQTVSYWPFLDILRTYLDLRDTDTEVDIARKLKQDIVDLFPQGWEDVLPFMGRLLSINLGDDIERKLSYYTPEQIRHQTLMRMRGVFTAISRRKPLLLILEDMHWSDDLSMDLVSLLMDDLAENPLMLLCIYRPERGHRCWQLGDIASRKCLERYTEITLKKLSSAQSRQLVESLLEIENLPEATREMILRKSEGNPFFIEEVIRYLIDRDLIYREDDRWKARREIEDIDVPDTIQSVLLSRVDRLEAETRYVLQCASVIGRLFRYRLLEHLSRNERDLEEHLSELEDRELVIEERTVPELEYSFKHALTQEATYQSILERRRRGFHHRVAEGIEALYRDRVADFYEELAHHYKLSGDGEKTIKYLLKSGIKLADQYANNEALKYFNEAERLIAESGFEYRKEKAILYKKRGGLLNRMGQWIKALRDYEEALKWSDDPHDRADLYLELGWHRRDTARGRRTWELGLQELPDGDKSKQRVLLEKSMLSDSGGAETLRGLHHLAEICQEMGDEGLLAIIYLEIARTQSFVGNYSDEYSQKAMSILERLGDLSSLQKMCSTLGRLMLWYRTGLEWIPKSVPYFTRAIEIAEQIGDIRQQAVELSVLGVAYNRLGEYDKAIENSEKALGMFSEAKDLHALGSMISILEVYAKLRQDNLVISTYKRIMRSLASLELDEESQAMALLIPFDGTFPGCYEIYRPYLKFRNSYSIMGKESEFPGIARKTLEDLLTYADSRPQVAWYHIMLMDLCLELGDVSSARSHAEVTVSVVDGMGRPHYMSGLYPAYILLNDIETANELAYTYMTHESHPMRFPNILSNALGSMEITYRRFGQAEAFEQICERLFEHGDDLKEWGISLNQFHLKLVECPASFSHVEFEEVFDWGDMEEPPAPWEWIDPDGMSSYEVCHDPRCIKITSAYGSEIRRGTLMAPRLSSQLSGDFAIETRMGEGKYGGLFIWKDGEGVTLKRWIWGGGPIVLVNQNSIETCGSLGADLLILRLERRGNVFRGYCSDGENWYSCGWTECEIEDPVQVGIFASCHEDTQQKVTSFDYFRIYRE